MADAPEQPSTTKAAPIDLAAMRRERAPVTDHTVEFDGESFAIPARDNWPGTTIGLVMEGRFEEAFALAMGPVEYERMRVKAGGLTIGDLSDLLNALNTAEGANLGKSQQPGK